MKTSETCIIRVMGRERWDRSHPCARPAKGHYQRQHTWEVDIIPMCQLHGSAAVRADEKKAAAQERKEVDATRRERVESICARLLSVGIDAHPSVAFSYQTGESRYSDRVILDGAHLLKHLDIAEQDD